MSAPGRPRREYRSAQHEGSPESALRLRVLAVAWAFATALAAATANARDVHGVADAIALPDVVLAWAVARGAGSDDATVVIRIAVEGETVRFADAIGVDPFTQARKPALAATRIDRNLDVRVPRAHFADFPRTELRFFGSEAAVRDNAPSLMVYYLGVPDTTPEFASAAALDAYLTERIARARREGGSRTP